MGLPSVASGPLVSSGRKSGSLILPQADLIELQPKARDLFLREPRDRPELPFFDSDSESYGLRDYLQSDLGRDLNRKCWQCCFEAIDHGRRAVIMAAMKLLTEYLERALSLERPAAGEQDKKFIEAGCCVSNARGETRI